MYKIEKRIQIDVIRKLKLDYDSIRTMTHCQHLIVTVYCKADTLNVYGMIADPEYIEKNIMKRMHYRNLNEVMNVNPTLENIAEHIQSMTPCCYRVRVEDAEGNVAEFEKD